MSYSTHAIDNTPTIRGIAASSLTSPAMLAVKFNSSGKLALPSAGDPAIGIVLADSEDIASGGVVNVQIKDICYWMSASVISAGAELAPDAAGKAVVATSGAFILAIALEDGTPGKPVKVQVVKAGYKSGGSVTPITLAGLSDVNITSVANGDTIVYDSTSQKYINKAPVASLDDLSDVDLTTPATNGQILKYVAADSVFKAAADA